MASQQKFSRRKMVAFSLLPLLILLSILEVGLRLYPIHQISSIGRGGFVIPDKDLFWALQTNNPGPRQTNELGFRDHSFDAAAETKILLLGDSISWGDGISSIDQLYPNLLEGHLSKFLGHRVEVVNTGVPGYSTFQQLIVLQKWFDRIQPGLVILQFCLNDVTERYLVLSEYGGTDYFLGIDTRQHAQGVVAFFRDHSRIFETLLHFSVDFAKIQSAYNVKNLAKGEAAEKLEPAWEKVFEEIQSIAKFVNSKGRQVVLVIAPYKFQLENPEKLNLPQQKLTKFALGEGIHVIDLMGEFSNKDKTGESLFRDANHFSTLGHQLAADKIAKQLIQFKALR